MDPVLVMFTMAIGSALGMGLAWYIIICSKLDKETFEHLRMIDYYDKKAKEYALEIWSLKRQIADLRGVEFTEQKPELTYEKYPWRR